MKTGWKIVLAVGGALTLYETVNFIAETSERHHYFDVARAYSDLVGKPLLRVGMKRRWVEPPNGDYTIDIDPAVLMCTDTIGVLADERDMPFPDKYFGACFNEHTLEHLADAESVEMAVSECMRAADLAILLAPSPYSIRSNLFAAGHRLRLWLDQKNNKITVRRNDWQTPFIFDDYPNYDGHRGLGQAMVISELNPPIVVSS